MSVRRVILWRHGRTAFNHEDRFQGQLDVPLDTVGVAQAQHAAAFLADVLETELDAGRPVALGSSDLSRAAATCQALATRLRLPVELDPALREVDAGHWQGLLREEIVEQWPAQYEAWRRGDDDIAAGGAETRPQLAARTADAVRRHTAHAQGSVVVLASHGAALAGAIPHLLGLSPAPRSLLAGMRNCHWAELEVRDDLWRLVAYNVGAPGAENVTAHATPVDLGLESDTADRVGSARP